MNQTLLTNCKFYRNGALIKNEDILTNQKKILAIGTGITRKNAEVIDLENNLISPGFIDLQVNGGSNIFFNSNIDSRSVGKIYDAHSKKGTRFILITLITTELSLILKALQVVKIAMEENPGILGLHLEGPFLNKEKSGAHNKNYIRQPTDKELSLILTQGKGILKKMTIAPELFTKQQLKQITDQDIVLSAGHSNATYEEAVTFFKNGVNCVTHLYNAMSPFQSKKPGLVGAALTSNTFAGIIADGLHTHFSALDLAYQLKKDKLFLVSDASFTGIENQDRLFIEGTEVSIKNGKIVTQEGRLAGASITLSDAVKNCVREMKINKEEILNMATAIPAKLLGKEKAIGAIAVGNAANLNILDDQLNVVGTLN